MVGVNGAGKSTFLKVLAGQTEPTTGSLTIGANVMPGYFSQHAMDLLDPEKTVYETVQDAIPMANIGVVRNLCAAFLFQGDAVEKRIKLLSGGEKSRVLLATLLARPLNLLILDEPTNHLDFQSRQILLQALAKFTGTVVLVSHDRYFLRSLVGRVFEIDHGEMIIYEGSYEYYLSKTQRTASRPPEVFHRPLRSRRREHREKILSFQRQKPFIFRPSQRKIKKNVFLCALSASAVHRFSLFLQPNSL